MIIVNGIDGEKVDLPGLLTQIQQTFGTQCLPINLPAQRGRQVVDCFFNPGGNADFLSVEAAHNALVDQVVEIDPALMELYLEQSEAIWPEQLHEPFERALREGLTKSVFTILTRLTLIARSLSCISWSNR
jgi:elongation factor G